MICGHGHDKKFKYPYPQDSKIIQMPYPRAKAINQIPAVCPTFPPPSPLSSAGLLLMGALANREIMRNSRDHVSCAQYLEVTYTLKIKKKFAIAWKLEWCLYNIDPYICNL